MFKSLTAALTLAAAMSVQSLTAQNAQTIQVDVGSFCGFWRLQNTDTGEFHQCDPATNPLEYRYYEKGYSLGSCTLSVPDGPIKYELMAMAGHELLEVGGSDIISVPTPDSMNTIIDVWDDGKIGYINLPTVTVFFETNGYRGRYVIDNNVFDINNPGTCAGRSVELPRSSAFNVVIGARQNSLIEIDHQGFVSTPATDSLINVDHNTIGFKTIAVFVAPEVHALSKIFGVTDWLTNRPNEVFEGPYMVRLVQGAKYALASSSRTNTGTETLFDIGATCGTTPQMIKTTGNEYFHIREQCGSELPLSP